MNQCSGLALSVAQPSAGDGAHVEQWCRNGSDAELWSLQSVTSGVYTLTNRANTGARLDVVGGSSSPGAAVQLYHSDGTSAQSWGTAPAPAQ